MADLYEELRLELRQYEWQFAAAAMSASEIALEDCAWFSPDLLSEEMPRSFWKKLREYNGDAVKAALELGIELDLLDWSYKIIAPAQPEQYARKIAETNYLLNALSSLGQMAKVIGNRDLEAFQQKIKELSDVSLAGTNQAESLDSVNEKFKDVMYEPENSIQTWIPDWNKIIGGFFHKETTIFAGQPSTGKTALMGQLAKYVAEKGEKVLFFSLEMPPEQVWARIVCSLTDFSWQDVRTKRVKDEDLLRIEETGYLLKDRLGGNFILDGESFSLESMLSKVQQARPSLVIIDNLNEIHKPSGADNVVFYPDALKFIRQYIARRNNCHVILIHHIVRMNERKSKIPEMTDLAWAAGLEREADIILMAYRDDLYNSLPSGTFRVPYQLWVKKNRQGSSNMVVNMLYDLHKQIFLPLETREYSVRDLG